MRAALGLFTERIRQKVSCRLERWHREDSMSWQAELKEIRPGRAGVVVVGRLRTLSYF